MWVDPSIKGTKQEEHDMSLGSNLALQRRRGSCSPAPPAHPSENPASDPRMMYMEQSQQTEQRTTVAHCYWHPNVETGLSCSPCGKSICPQCMIQAHVGIRCKECGKAAPMPTFDVRPHHYARAVAVAVAVAIVGGMVWWGGNLALLLIFQGLLPDLIGSLLAIPLGYFGGDLISRSVNRKRSKGLAFVSGGAVVLAVVISLQLPGILRLPGAFLGPSLGLYGLLFIGVGIYLAVQRLRR